jgi:hypothetical protein
MCFKNKAADQAQAEAAQAREQQRLEEETRKANIQSGQGRLDEAFAQFDDNYFGKVKDDYTGAKNPDIDTQYGKAKDALTAALARRGTLSSTIAGNAFGDLDTKRNDARSDVANEAADAANKFRSSIEKSKGDLISLNQSAADPTMIAARAKGEATSLVAPKATGELGDLFGSALAPFVSYQRAAMFSPTGRSYFSAPPTSGSGSGSVVG